MRSETSGSLLRPLYILEGYCIRASIFDGETDIQQAIRNGIDDPGYAEIHKSWVPGDVFAQQECENQYGQADLTTYDVEDEIRCPKVTYIREKFLGHVCRPFISLGWSLLKVAILTIDVHRYFRSTRDSVGCNKRTTAQVHILMPVVVNQKGQCHDDG
jgi:hypothetical protein